MFDKEFTNNATQPMKIKVIAAVNHEGIVTRILASGGLHERLAERHAESLRMFAWVKATFVGQDIVMLQSHNGVVPPEGLNFVQASGSADFLRDNDRRYVILEDIDPRAVAEAMLTAPGILDLLLPQPQTKIDLDFTIDTSGAQRDIAKLVDTLMNPKWAFDVPHRKVDPRVYTKDYGTSIEGPTPGTYWQSRTEPTHFFKLTSAVACIGHWHVEMHRLLDGEPDDRVWVSEKQWSDLFVQVDRATALAPLSPQSSVGPNAVAVPIPRSLIARIDKLGETVSKAKKLTDFARPVGRIVFPNLRDAVHEREQKEVEQFVAEVEAPKEVVNATQQVLDGVQFTGTEAPPIIGEKYQRVDSGNVFTVIGVTQEDMGAYTVTMEAENHHVKYKYTFRSHAQWLAKWRPADSEGNVKPVVFIDIENESAGLAREVRETLLPEHANRMLQQIAKELHKRVPGWDRQPHDGVILDDGDLIVRAIRTLFRGGVEVENELIAWKTALQGVEELAEKRLSNVEKRDVWSLEVVRDASGIFKSIYGITKLKELLQEFGYQNILQVPVADRPSWVRKLREYASANMP